MPNLQGALLAIVNDARVITLNLFFARWFWAFICGVFLSIILAAFISTANPHHIPIILRYSKTESFQKISPRDKEGTYKYAFADFAKIYLKIRLLSLVAFIIFCFMIIVIAITD